jgi:hypothetical protein
LTRIAYRVDASDLHNRGRIASSTESDITRPARTCVALRIRGKNVRIADVAGYKQTVLTAFRQIEDSLSSSRLLSQQIEEQQETIASAQRFLDMATAR